MFGKKKRVIEKFPYDPEKQEPVVRASICTGEKVAGFRDRDGGTLHEVTLIRDYEDMKADQGSFSESQNTGLTSKIMFFIIIRAVFPNRTIFCARRHTQ